MIPLKTNRLILIWLCIYPTDANTSQGKRIAHILFSVSIFAVNLIGIISNGWYFIRYKSVSLEDALFALITIIGTVNAAYINVITFYLRHKIVRLFEILDQFYESCKHLPQF